MEPQLGKGFAKHCWVPAELWLLWGWGTARARALVAMVPVKLQG